VKHSNLPQRYFFILKVVFSKVEEVFKQTKIIIFIGLLVLIGVLVAPSKQKWSVVPAFGGTYTEGVTGEINHLFPLLKQTEAEKDAAKLIFSSLIKYNGQRQVVGDLAERWEISPDGKEYIFYLKKAQWHDGQPVTADDVVFTFTLLQNPELQSPFEESFRGIEVARKDPQTVLFKLKQPFAPFLFSLTVPIVPKHLLGSLSPSQIVVSQFLQKPVGSGPFQFKGMKKDKSLTTVTLLYNKNYYAQRPYIKKFVFQVYQDPNDLKKAYQKRKILSMLSETKSSGPAVRLLLPQYKAVFVNLCSGNLDLFLRKALFWAVDKNEIASALPDQEVYLITSPLFEQSNNTNSFDLQKAQSFLSRSHSSKEITLLSSPFPENIKIAEVLKRDWERLGVKTQLITLANSELEKRVNNREYDLFLTGVNQKGDEDLYPFWHSSQAAASGLNFSCLKNPEVDSLLEESRQISNGTERDKRYQKVAQVIQDEAAAFFLYQPVYYYQTYDIVKGKQETKGVTKADRFWNVNEWYLKIKKVKK